MSTADNNQSSSDNRDEAGQQHGLSGGQGGGGTNPNEGAARRQAADKPDGAFNDDDFIPKISQVRSRRAESGDAEGELSGADFSAAALAIEMLAVGSMDSMPVTAPPQAPEPVPNNNEPAPPQTAPRMNMDMQEFGFHKEVASSHLDSASTQHRAIPQHQASMQPEQQMQQVSPAPPHPGQAVQQPVQPLRQIQAAPPLPEQTPPMQHPSQQFLQQQTPPMQNAEEHAPPLPVPPQMPAPQTGVLDSGTTSATSVENSFVDSLILQSTGLDELWAAHEDSPETPEPSPAAVQGPTPAPPNALAPPDALTQAVPIAAQSLKERSATVRSSLYWVVQEARLVTHGVFANYNPPAVAQHATAPTAQAQAQAPPAPVKREVSPEQPPSQKLISAEPQKAQPAGPNEPYRPPRLTPLFSNFQPAEELSSDAPHLQTDKEPVDDAPTILTPVPDTIDGDTGLPKSVSFRKPDVSELSGRHEQMQAQRALEDQRKSLYDNDPNPAPPAIEEVQEEEEEEGEDTIAGGAIRLPLFGTVSKTRLKRQAITVGSVFLLCIASGIVMYDTISSNKNTASKPGPDLQHPNKAQAPEQSEAAIDEETPVATSAPAAKADTKSQLKAAFKLEQNKDYQGALEQFDKILETNKGNVKALHGRGRVLTKLQNYKGALEDLTNAARIDQRNELILLDLAAVKYLLADYSGAAREYELILSLHPGDVDALYGRGISYAALAKNGEAIADFETVIQLKPTYDKAYRQLCTTYLAINQPDKAEAVITVAMKACGPDADLHFSRGLAFYQMGRKESAIEDYNEAVRLNPKRKEYFNDRGYVLMELGRLNEAKSDFQKALALDRKYKLAVDNLDRLKKLNK